MDGKIVNSFANDFEFSFSTEGQKSKATLRSERSSFGELALAFPAKIEWRFLSKHETI